MAPPVRKLPAGYELAIGGTRGHKVTKHKAEKPFKVRPSRASSVLYFEIFFHEFYILKLFSNYITISKINMLNSLEI